jgi:hypothetical protein
MAYISQAEKQAIAPAVKSLLKLFGIKGSLSIQNHSTIHLTLTSGIIDFIGSANRMNQERAQARGEVPRVIEDHMDVNVYWIDSHFDGVAAEVLKQAVAVLKGEGWFNHSDIQSDYFHLKHYVSISVGKWNKPYSLQA